MRLKRLVVLWCVLVAAGVAAADVNGSSLKPPAGARVAIIVFEDLECPSCAQAAPLLEQAAKTYNVPLVIRDFPLRNLHPWAFDAAVMARYIDDKYGRETSLAFRDYIYLYQPYVTKDNLRSYADKFAASRKLDLPFVFDPRGEIAAKIKLDEDAGQQIGLFETPTVVVVGAKDWKYVRQLSDLYLTIEKVKQAAGPAPAGKPAGRVPAKSARVARKPTS